ncbi:hypothetical protein HOY82DRAFT_581899 [Tuber indicum]|nr:hypothetical protein HOY82DRAFT_581899 [Tuber indicum]
MCEAMEGGNDRTKSVHYMLQLSDGKAPVNAGVSGFHGTGDCDFVHAFGNGDNAFVAQPRKTTYAPMDLAVVIGWEAIMKAIFPNTIGIYFLQLSDSVFETRAQINAVVNQALGLCTSQVLYWGTYIDYENTFQLNIERLTQVHIASSGDVAFHVDNADTKSLRKTLTHGSPVIGYLQRHDKNIQQPVNFKNRIVLKQKTELPAKALASREGYACDILWIIMASQL